MGLTSEVASQTLTGTPSDITDIFQGVHYRVDPNPASSSPITPADNGEAVTPMVFELASDSGSQWTFTFLMPDSLFGTIGYIPCTYDDSSGYHVQRQNYWNASRPRIFTADSLGKITIGVAPSFTVPVSALLGDTYANLVICLATRMKDGFTLIDTTYLTVTPAGSCGSCPPYNVDCDVTHVVRGLRYDVVFDAARGASVISPADNGEATTDLGADLAADPGQNLVVKFTLPTYVTGTAGTIPISFGASAGVRIEDGTFFDPKVANKFSTSTRGAISLRLGFSFTVPYNALIGDTYAGTVLCTVSYDGSPGAANSAQDSGITSASSVAAITVTVSEDIIPRQFSLHQNFPNPFNSTTTIRYDLPELSSVSLKIYNPLGQEIATLLSGAASAGTYVAHWQADAFPSGVYFYRIKAGSFIQVKKMILTR
ncbi:MAG: T9SS type A sorting domain-containing protein [Ignavibacteria bacterium]|nr:T9SS type A sorting domain-containing protein [Ignavibacteria bacterium]